MENVDLEVPVDCAVCMLVIVRPTKLPCKHVFCQGCAKACLEFKWECPMCRLIPSRQFNFNVDEELMQMIKEKADAEVWEARDKQAGPIV